MAKYKSKLTPVEAIRKWKNMSPRERKRRMPPRKNQPCYYPVRVRRRHWKTGKEYTTTVWRVDKKCKAEMIERERYRKALKRLKRRC